MGSGANTIQEAFQDWSVTLLMYGLPFLSGNFGACPPPTTATRLVRPSISACTTPPTTSKSVGWGVQGGVLVLANYA